MKKFIFPFFNKERHDFLSKKWWFRLIVVFYVAAILIVSFSSFSENMDSYLSCYDTTIKIYKIDAKIYDEQAFENEYANCKIGVYEAILPSVGYSIIVTLIFHYLAQLFFFKLIIDYIVLGSKKNIQ